MGPEANSPFWIRFNNANDRAIAHNPAILGLLTARHLAVGRAI